MSRLTDRTNSILTEPVRPAAFTGVHVAPGTNEVVVFIGPENLVTEQRTGWMEMALAQAWRDVRPRFRHMGWEGDTVYRQNRMENWGSWKENLDAVEATTVFVWFGQLEALDRTRTPADFAVATSMLVERLLPRTPRLVLVAPPPFEKPTDPRVPDNTPRNVVVQHHVEALRQLAARRGLGFVDLFTPLIQRPADAAPLTRDGLHLTPDGLLEVAALFAASLGVPAPSPGDEALRGAIVEKNRLWFDTWRPMNWAFAYGDRTTQPFAQGADGRPPLVEELKIFRPRLEHADATVHALALGQAGPEPLPPPRPRADPEAATPEEEMSRFKLREGFAVNLFADEKLRVARPVQIRWDERGRLWVACTPAYPQLQPGERANDFLLVLEDTDGDGRADRSTVWADGLTMPMGMEFGDGGVYVCENTQLVHLRDTDGDGKADSRRVVLGGFGTGDTHQTINSVRWGPDGRLWFTQGYHIWSYVESPGGITELNRSGLWRLNPRTLKLESFLNESAAGLNCWGVAFDDFGQVFHGSGADFVLWHTTPALIPTLHPLNLGAGFAGSRGKSMEPEFLVSSHLPDDLRGAVLKNIYFTSQVGLYRLSDDGAGFRSEDLGDLISSSSNEFRPVESRVGPDGAIYICDWLNTVIGHYQASYRDPRRDHSHGRIWRVTANGRPALKRPPLEAMDAAQLMAQFDSPERWVRDNARYALFRRPKAEVITAADALTAREDGRSEVSARRLYEVSGVYAAHEEARPVIIERLLASENFRWRAWAARLVGLWATQIPEPLAWLTRAVVDPHPRVRLEAVVAASQVPSADAVKVATLAMDQEMDSSIQHALTQCIHALAPRWQPALADGSLDFGPRLHALARMLTTVGDPRAIGRVRELLQSGNATGPVRDSLLGVLVEHGAPDDVAYAISQAPDSPTVLSSLVTVAFRKQDEGYHKVLEQLLTSPFPAGRIAGCRVALAWNQDFGQLPRIRDLAFNEAATAPERAAAIAALGRIRGKAIVAELLPLTDSTQAMVRLAAFEAVAPHEPDAVASRLAKLLANARAESDVPPALGPMLSLKGGANSLALAIHAAPPRAEVARWSLQHLGRIGRDDRTLVDALRTAAGIAASRLEYSPEVVARILATARNSGDAGRGAALLRSEDMACLGCHRIGNEGGNTTGPSLGPDITAIGRAMTPELIVEAVFWPRRQVKEGFLLTQIVTRDERQWQGYKITEDNAELRLRDLAGGPEIRLRKSEIKERNDVGTLMPEGQLDALSESQRSDMIRYLLELGR